MIDTTWIMSPRPVVPWGLRKALNWVSRYSSRRSGTSILLNQLCDVDTDVQLLRDDESLKLVCCCR